MSDNGNGHVSPAALALADSICDGRHERTTLRAMVATLDDHNARGIPLKPELIEAYQIIAGRLMASPHARVQIMALQAVVAALKYNLDRYIAADRCSRLENEQPTENISHRVYEATFK